MANQNKNMQIFAEYLQLKFWFINFQVNHKKVI